MAGPRFDVLLIDGTYELFRHYYGRPQGSTRPELAATRGVLATVVAHLARGVTHLGVATDHVIESFRNDLWPGYKTSAGVPPDLLAQFPVLEESLAAMGVVVWPMVELEADDAMASAAAVAAADGSVEQVLIASPDKDLAQCVSERRIVQLDGRSGKVSDEDAVVERFGVGPTSIPDWLALVGDTADGFPGIPAWGKVSAGTVLAHYGHLEGIPDDVADWDAGLRRSVRGAPRLAERLAADRELAELFRLLATLRIDDSVLGEVGELEWHGPTDAWAATCEGLGDAALAGRVARLGTRSAVASDGERLPRA